MTEIFEKLEFDVICKNVSELCASPVTAQAILETRPATNIKEATGLLIRTGDALQILASHRPSLAFDDILPLVEKARVGATLQPFELLSIKTSILSLRSLKSCVESANGCDSLKDLTAPARVCDDLEHEIESSVENETDLKDSASEKLYSLRRAITRANAKLKEQLDNFTRQSDISKYLQDNIVTIRGGRYVVPVRSECRSSVKGLVHDVSSTGATVFIEPFAIVEANNQLRTLKTEEQIEVERILVELTKSVVRNAHDLENGQEVLTECGIIFAKAEYAKQIDAYRPQLNTDGKINLISARHPLISRECVVPVDIVLDKRILLISGPNTGGKTVALKTVGLFSLMAASGMFLPAADGSEICIFNKIYCDIGDSQSITQSLSTFSAHIKNLVSITSGMDETSLVLLDEVGDGTDPDEGAALAIAIIKKLLRTHSTAVVTTHFNAVKEFALGCPEVINGCMQFDNENFKPTYRLLTGASGSSYALEIAEELGLSAEIISDARNALSEEKITFDRMMRETERLRNEAMRAKQECEKLKEQAAEDAQRAQKLKTEYERKLNEINENARALVRRYADEYAERAEEIIDEIKEKLKVADEAALFEARRTAKQLSDGVPSDNKLPSESAAPPSPEELVIGARVFVSGLNKEGIIAGKPRGKKVLVAIGSIKTEIPVLSLTLIAKEKKPAKPDNTRSVAEPVNKELMMLGYTVDDATAELDRVLSDIPPHSTLRIVHGKGTGALGKGIQNYLRRQPRVKNFRYGRYGEGDTGVTIVEIK